MRINSAFNDFQVKAFCLRPALREISQGRPDTSLVLPPPGLRLPANSAHRPWVCRDDQARGARTFKPPIIFEPSVSPDLHISCRFLPHRPPFQPPPARQSFPCNLTSLIARKTLWVGGSRRGAIRRDQPSKPSKVSSGFSRPYLPKALSLSQHDSNHFKSC